MPETRAAGTQPQQDLAAETATKASRGQRAEGSTARSTHITREQATLTAQLHPSHSQTRWSCGARKNDPALRRRETSAQPEPGRSDFDGRVESQHRRNGRHHLLTETERRTDDRPSGVCRAGQVRVHPGHPLGTLQQGNDCWFPVAAASHGSPNGLDRQALASALAEYRIRRKQVLGGLTHEYYVAA